MSVCQYVYKCVRLFLLFYYMLCVSLLFVCRSVYLFVRYPFLHGLLFDSMLYVCLLSLLLDSLIDQFNCLFETDHFSSMDKLQNTSGGYQVDGLWPASISP